MQTDPMPSLTSEDILAALGAKAQESLKETGNCAQSTFAVLKEQFGLDDENDAIYHALFSFPGLAGRTETCGACSGSMMALGLVFGQQGFGQARRFCERFAQENGSTQCGAILESNLGRTYRFPEDFVAYRDDAGGAVCLGVVQSAARIAGAIVLDHLEGTQAGQEVDHVGTNYKDSDRS